MEVILTPRLRLLPLDIYHLQTLLSHPASLQVYPATMGVSTELRLSPQLITPQIDHALEAKIIKMQAADPQLHAWYTYWLIEIIEQQVGAGLVGFKGKPDPAGMVEFGYGIDENYQNHGYMTEAVQGMIRWAFAQPGCRRITAETLQTNLASQHVLINNGFRVVKETRDTYEWELKP